MSQPPSPSDPRHNRIRSARPQRVLRAPHERFADVDPPPGAPESSLDPTPEPAIDPFALPYGEEELEARRLSPRQRREKAKQERREQRRNRFRRTKHSKSTQPDTHQRRAEAAREFAHHAREDAPHPAAVPAPRKRRNRNLKKWLWRAGLIVLAVSVGEGLVFALTSPRFNIDSVEVTGQISTPGAQVTPIVNHLVGQNLIRAKTHAVEATLEKLPTVAEAHVTRLMAWPPRATIRLVERVPSALIGAGTDYFVVDESGMPFRRADLHGEDRELTAITGKDLTIQLGKRIAPKSWGRVAELLTALQQDNQDATWAWQPRRVFFDKDSASMWVPAAPGARKGPELLIRLGGDRWEEKLARARETLAYFERTGRDAATLDLVSYDRPVWRPRALPKSEPQPAAIAPLAAPQAPANVPAAEPERHLAHGEDNTRREG